MYYLDCFILISHGTRLQQVLLSMCNIIFSEKDMLVKDLLPVHWDQKVQELAIKEKKFQILCIIISCQGKSLVSFGIFFPGRCISLTKIL